MSAKEVKIGDIFWLKTENEISHPHVLIEITPKQATLCAITTNAKKAEMPGTVVLEIGEGNLDKQSIVEVYKKIVIDRDLLGQPFGNLSEKRIIEIQKGIKLIENTYF